MKNYPLYIAALLLIIFSSCEKNELPVKAHEAGDVTTATVDLGTPYKYQVYFSLSANAIVSQNMKTAWDIGCEPSADGYHIVLNASKSMFAFNTGKTDFASVVLTDTAGFTLNKKWDAPSGNLDSTAIGDWRTTTPVYVIDKGYDQNGKWLGLEKLQILSVTNSSYGMRFAAINGTGDTIIQIVKDTTYNLAFASFTTNNQLIIEPPKNTWDIEFTQYTFIFYDYNPPLPYLVTGCLLNRSGTTAVKDSADLFASIIYGNISNYNLSSDISTIGYDWKTFNGTSYTVNIKDNYIIRTSAGKYYKMYFTGYYNANGAEGNPKWEYQGM